MVWVVWGVWAVLDDGVGCVGYSDRIPRHNCHILVKFPFRKLHTHECPVLEPCFSQQREMTNMEFTANSFQPWRRFPAHRECVSELQSAKCICFLSQISATKEYVNNAVQNWSTKYRDTILFQNTISSFMKISEYLFFELLLRLSSKFIFIKVYFHKRTLIKCEHEKRMHLQLQITLHYNFLLTRNNDNKSYCHCIF